jgi:hypothetical protein
MLGKYRIEKLTHVYGCLIQHLAKRIQSTKYCCGMNKQFIIDAGSLESLASLSTNLQMKFGTRESCGQVSLIFIHTGFIGC